MSISNKPDISNILRITIHGIQNALAIFFGGLFGEFIFSGIAGLCKGVLNAFGIKSGSSVDQEILAYGFFMVIIVILMAIGIIKSLKNKEYSGKNKLTAIVVHFVFFFLMSVIAKILVPLCILIVVIAVLCIFFHIDLRNFMPRKWLSSDEKQSLDKSNARDAIIADLMNAYGVSASDVYVDMDLKIATVKGENVMVDFDSYLS